MNASSIDLEKRNRVIWRYEPDLFEQETFGANAVGDVSAGAQQGDTVIDLLEITAAFPPVRQDLGLLLQHLDRFAGMNREQVIAELHRLYRQAGALGPTTLSLEEFFDGNGQQSSIAPNLGQRHPGLAVMRETLEWIRRQPGVEDVRIEVHEWPNPLEPADDGLWIAAGRVMFWCRKGAASQLETWCEPLRLDGVEEYRERPLPVGGPAVRAGLRVMVGTWD